MRASSQRKNGKRPESRQRVRERHPSPFLEQDEQRDRPGEQGFQCSSHRAATIPRGVYCLQPFGTFDYVIVGAGSAGCLLANRLSANADTRVLLIEAGGKDDWFWIDVPVGYLYTIANPRTDWCYKTQPDEHLAGRSIHYARGRVLGGCSSINAMIYMRGQKEDYDHWAALGQRRLVVGRSAAVLRAARGLPARRGGRLRLGRRSARRGSARALGDHRRLAKGRGRVRDPAGEGVQPRRQFRLRVFPDEPEERQALERDERVFAPVMHRKNLTVVTDALVTRVRFEGRTAVGVEFRTGGEDALQGEARGDPRRRRDRVSPNSAAFRVWTGALAAGASVPVVQDLPGVGENLHDHLQIRMQYKVKNVRTLNELANSPWGSSAMGLEYLFFKTGPLTMPPSQLGAFARSDPAQPTPNIEWHVQPLSLDKFGDPLHPFPRDHAERLQSQADLARLGANQVARSADAPRHQAQLPLDAGGSQGRGGGHALHAAHPVGKGARAL
jgi:choline dehydrogenase